jgi:hypothetical protein
MAFYFGIDFAKRFKENADKHQRPDLVIYVTNAPNVTPQSLLSRGFKLQRTTTTLSTMQFWVHPNGNEVWLITPAKFTPSAPPAPAPLPVQPKVHPDIEEIRGYVAEYSQRKTDMIAGARMIEARKNSLSPQQYKAQRDQWWQQYEAWDQELDDITDQVIPDMDGDLTPQEQELKRQEIDNLNKIRESWPRDVMEPGK